MLAVDWSPEELQALEQEARESGRSPVDIIKEAVLIWLEDQEDLRDAKSALADLRAGRETTVPAEDIMRRYGLEA